MGGYRIQHLLSNKEKETCISKAIRRVKVKGARALNCSTFLSVQSPVSVILNVSKNIMKNIYHNITHKPAHEPKAQIGRWFQTIRK